MVKKMPLTRGKFAIVDDEDYEWLNQWKWCALRAPKTFYAIRAPGRPLRKTILLHREIMNAPPGLYVDHRDGDGLNCTRANMRLATHAENKHNSPRQSNNTSGFKGVGWYKASRKWQAQIQVNSKQIHLGYYNTAEEAALAYDEAARKYHGRFARTNFE